MTRREWLIAYRAARTNPETVLDDAMLATLSDAGVLPVIRRQKLRMLLVRNAPRMPRDEWLSQAKHLAQSFVGAGFADDPTSAEGSDRYERYAWRMYRRVGACTSRFEMPKVAKRR